MSADPLHQFEVKKFIPIDIGGVDIGFTNASLFMVLAALIGLGMIWLSIRKQLLIPNAGQSIGEALFGFIRDTARDSIGEGYEKYMPFIFTVFTMVFLGNFLGLFPYSFTFTSQLAPVGAFAILGMVVSIIVGLRTQGFKWFRTFFPVGVPVFMAPIIIPIEVFSFLSKPFSLTMRLVMNMIVGHLMMKVFAGLVYTSGLVGVIPLVAIGGLILFEMFIAFLQAYIFTILTSIYIGEAAHAH